MEMIWGHIICRWVLSLLFLLCLAGCQHEKEPIKIGFLGVLKGTGSSLGKSGRNATQLAVNEVNDAGGINGRRLRLIVKDSGMNAETTRRSLDDLKDFGAQAVVGPMTSNMGVVAVAHESRLPMVSPTVATQSLNGIQDNFFRVYPDVSSMVDKLTAEICRQSSLRRFVIISDEDNSSFSQSWSDNFALGIQACGGEIVFRSPYRSSRIHSFSEMVERLQLQAYDAVLILANSFDTSLLAQQFLKNEMNKQLICSEWSTSNILQTMGSKAVEGIVMVQGFPFGAENEKYMRFVRTYREYFGEKPDFAACYAYEATQIIISALKKTGTGEDVKEALMQTKGVKGLFDFVVLDDYGDAQRNTYLNTIKEGRVTALSEFK